MTEPRRSSLQRNQYGCAEFTGAARFQRRTLLQAGAIGSLGLGLSEWNQLLQAGEGLNPTRRTKAKACIFLFMWGGPSQLDTFDFKPDAPAEVRGEFKPIATNVPGIQICEHFSRVAQHADKLAIIRSLSHDDPAHLSSGHATVTGQWAPVLKSDATPPSEKDSRIWGR